MGENRSFQMKTFQVLMFISGVSVLTLASPEFHLVNISKTYEDAKTHCREQYTDLASVHNRAEMNILTSLDSSLPDRAWIGLEVGAVWMWHWSWPDHPVDYLNWRSGEPQATDRDACAAMDQRGEWFESNCTQERRFVCGGDRGSSALTLVSSTKSWRGAQDHCRGLSLDLVNIRSETENQAVRNVSAAQDVWIGLFKDPWRWADGSNSSFRYWRATQPNYLEDQECAAAIFRAEGKWNDLRCGRKRKFICGGAYRFTSTSVRPTTAKESTTSHLQTHTTANTTANMTTNVTTNTTIHLTTNMPTTNMTTNTTINLTTNMPTTNMTTNTTLNMTTNMPTTIMTTNTTLNMTTNMPTTNMTTNTTLNMTTNMPTTSMTTNTTINMTTNMPTTNMTTNTTLNMTTNMPTTNTTANMTSITTAAVPTTLNTTDGIHNNTTTTAQNTTQLSTVTPTGNSHLILIQQNLTWLDALSYCRERHHDLVHVTTTGVQRQVEEALTKATTPHVWLGLRYTCKFNFWFWAGSTSACYQNWAPGHGLQRTYDCGVTGAVEATGGQRWVGLPETERLNFICSVCAG